MSTQKPGSGAQGSAAVAGATTVDLPPVASSKAGSPAPLGDDSPSTVVTPGLKAGSGAMSRGPAVAPRSPAAAPLGEPGPPTDVSPLLPGRKVAPGPAAAPGLATDGTAVELPKVADAPKPGPASSPSPSAVGTSGTAVELPRVADAPKAAAPKPGLAASPSPSALGTSGTAVELPKVADAPKAVAPKAGLAASPASTVVGNDGTAVELPKVADAPRGGPQHTVVRPAPVGPALGEAGVASAPTDPRAAAPRRPAPPPRPTAPDVRAARFRRQVLLGGAAVLAVVVVLVVVQLRHPDAAAEPEGQPEAAAPRRLAPPAPRPAPEPAKPAVEALPPAPEPPRAPVATGTLKVTCSPAATVSVNGFTKGQSPITVTLPAGRVQVDVENRALGIAQAAKVDIVANREVTQAFVFVKGRVALTLPPGALAVLDGKPVSGGAVEAWSGSHRVDVIFADGRRSSQTVEVVAGQTSAVVFASPRMR